MKSILVIDTPSNCSKCEFNKTHFQDGYTYNCDLNKKIETQGWGKHNHINDRHPQCPLQDTTELLKALEELDKAKEFAISKMNMFTKDGEKERLEIAYNKLHKVLGGK